MADLDLQAYFPYRLAVLAEQVSLAVAGIYRQRYGLSRQEWRVLAALGGREAIETRELGPLITLDKMQVSRAIQGLETRGLVSRSEVEGDRRRHRVRLTDAGRRMHREIVPLALAREREILADLSPPEAEQVIRLMEKVLAAATRLHDDDST